MPATVTRKPQPSQSAAARAAAQHRADRIAAARDRLEQRVSHSHLAVRF